MTFIQTKINVLEDLIKPESHMPDDITNLMKAELKFLKNEFSRANLKVLMDELILGYIEGAMTTNGESDIQPAKFH